MPRFDTVLFDLDGTLIDSADLIIESYHHVFATFGLATRTREEILAGMGVPLHTVFGTMTDDPAEIARWITTYRAYNLARHDDRVRAYPGVVDMVRRVHHAGCATGLVTSKNHSGAERGIALIGLSGAIDVIVGADDVTNPKPDPEPVRRALELLGASASAALFVGDSHHDIVAGRAADVRTAGITWGPFPRAHLEAVSPDHYCAVPNDLLAIIGIDAAAPDGTNVQGVSR